MAFKDIVYVMCWTKDESTKAATHQTEVIGGIRESENQINVCYATQDVIIGGGYPHTFPGETNTCQLDMQENSED